MGITLSKSSFPLADLTLLDGKVYDYIIVGGGWLPRFRQIKFTQCLPRPQALPDAYSPTASQKTQMCRFSYSKREKGLSSVHAGCLARSPADCAISHSEIRFTASSSVEVDY
jgi:hypothetical protein